MSATSNVNFDLLAEYNPLPETAEKPAAASTRLKQPSKRQPSSPSAAPRRSEKARGRASEGGTP